MAAAAALGVAWQPGLGAAQGTPAGDRDALMRSALSAAPPLLRDRVRVMDLEGHVLREGDAAFTCLPAPQGFAGPMCLDAQWMELLDALTHKRAPKITGIGLAYMMAGDSPDGGASNTDPAAAQPSARNDWIVEGPHIMIITPDAATMENVPAAHAGGGPYVMWKGTPYAHIMMPVGERPAQRQTAGR
ncbi:hypothetical protein DFH01_18020 [Falsiroseomonas bella]|uniref:Uncharacterized protein n=1 Tax=Falsiroseomonas bella TaxID=2184016 RepID=A0A317FA39_9PROT|nr:hypothetical protein DFH01_18020 [Falsiroseomonas bella]